MQWCIDFFYHKAKEWLCHTETAASAGKTGHECYAARQSQIYNQLAAHAEDSFGKVITIRRPEVPLA
jgi:hypothetical protein